MPRLKLGKRPARLGAVKFKLRKYVDISALPEPPPEFGHEDLVDQWLMLGNDSVGDCVLAGAAHESMLWNAEAGNNVLFDPSSVISDYSALTGYKPGDDSTDNGTDMQQAAEYRRTTGVLDAHGIRHRVIAYLAIDPTDTAEFYAAMYLFGSVGLGIRFPSSAMQQFDQKQPWTPVAGDAIEGGHYVPCVARRGGNVVCVTWGALQPITPDFLAQYADEAIVYLTAENLTAGRTLEGFSLDDLMADLRALKPPTPLSSQATASPSA